MQDADPLVVLSKHLMEFDNKVSMLARNLTFNYYLADSGCEKSFEIL